MSSPQRGYLYALLDLHSSADTWFLPRTVLHLLTLSAPALCGLTEANLTMILLGPVVLGYPTACSEQATGSLPFLLVCTYPGKAEPRLYLLKKEGGCHVSKEPKWRREKLVVLGHSVTRKIAEMLKTDFKRLCDRREDSHHIPLKETQRSLVFDHDLEERWIKTGRMLLKSLGCGVWSV